MPWRGSEYAGEFPSLGWEIIDWIRANCVIPDGDHLGEPYIPTPEMERFIVNHYRLSETATEEKHLSAFHYRRSQLVRPQKFGKGPLSAALICAEAVGPVVFAGWDANGEPVGRPWPTPLIQITAASEDQTANVYGCLVPMIQYGTLVDLMPDTGQTRINLPGGGRIDPVTSQARSRLGQRVTFVVQDETGMWTKSNGGQLLADTQRRGLAGMGGRAIETTNAWDPSETSVAQQTYESTAKDIYRDHRLAPGNLSYKNKSDRHRIHKYVYGDSWWVDLDRIDAEADELVHRDPTQAERFFGNRIVAGSRSWLEIEKWDEKCEPRVVPPGTKIALGFDGSDVDDWTGIRAETLDGYQFTPILKSGQPTYWDPKTTPTGRISHLEVMAAFAELSETYEIAREYWDPPFWTTEMEDRQAERGKRCVAYPTNQPERIFVALEQFKTDISGPESRLRHDGCKETRTHLRNAVERPRINQRYILGKASQNQKIDLAMSSVLAHKAACDAVASGENVPAKANYIYM